MPLLPPVKLFVTQSGIRIYRIASMVMPDLSGRIHLIVGAGPPTLVDTGSGHPDSIRDVVAGLETIRREFQEPLRLADIGRILITHGHVDHIGGTAVLVEATGAVVGVHALDRRAVEHFREHALVTRRRTSDFFFQAGIPLSQHGEKLALLGLDPDRIRSTPVGMLLEDGGELDGLRFIHTPGHSPGHTCILVDEILLCADHLLPITVPQQWPESTAAFLGLTHYLQSLEKLRRHPRVGLALGGHERAFGEVHQRIDQIEQTQHRRTGRARDVLARSDRPLTLAELATLLYPNAKGFHAVLAVMDVGARVEYLYERGMLQIANLGDLEGGSGGVPRYVA